MLQCVRGEKMKCIKILTDEDFGMTSLPVVNPRERVAARGLVFNSENKIAILNKKNKNEYKLVGGGIENDEEPKAAFQREVLEEAGCNIDIDKCLGITIEVKSYDNFKQTSYVFVAHVANDTKVLHFTKKEIDEGAQLLWLDIEDAMNLIKNSENHLIASKYEDVYSTKFIVRRDYEILKYYLQNK